MAISPFIADLRTKVGHDLLHLVGISAIVINDRDEVLLVDSKESGWMPIGGMIEVGEEPAAAAVREIFEETGVRAKPLRLVGVYDGPRVTYRNGDQVHYVTIVFRCQPISGDPHAHDDEARDAKFFPLSALPAMRPTDRRYIDDAVHGKGEAIFLLPDAGR